MRIGDVCSREPATCGPGDDLVHAARLMRDRSCGTLPVVDAWGKVIAMVTDRDLCLATAPKDLPASRLRVGEMMSSQVHACREQDDVETALKVMAAYRVRRLPVCDDEDRLRGLISIDDIVRAAGEAYAVRILRAMAEICRYEEELPLGVTARSGPAQDGDPPGGEA